MKNLWLVKKDLLPSQLPKFLTLYLQGRCGVVQSPSRVGLFVTPGTAACQASLSFTVSWSSLNSGALWRESESLFGDLQYLQPILYWLLKLQPGFYLGWSVEKNVESTNKCV